MKRKLDSILNVVGEEIFGFSKDALRVGVLFALLAGAGVVGYNHGINDYYPEIAEISKVNDSVLVVDNRYRLDHNSDLSDPNKTVFTSHKYQNNEE